MSKQEFARRISSISKHSLGIRYEKFGNTR